MAGPLFASDRERRLWLWTLVVLVAIWSTLGAASVLVAALRERGLLEISFVVVAVSLAAFVTWRLVRTRPTWQEVGVAIGVGLAYWMVFIRMENPAERTHLMEYGIVAALIHQALQERVRNGRAVPWPAALTVAATAVLGLLDESIQAVLPSRVFDWQDVLFNALAGFMVTSARLAIEPVTRPGWRLWVLWTLAGAWVWGWVMDPSSFGLATPVRLMDGLPPLEIPPPLSIATGTAGVTILQWLILRRYVPRAYRWLIAGGAVLLVATGIWAAGLLETESGWAFWSALYGLLAGTVQWSVLRLFVRGAAWWIPVSAIAWILAVMNGAIGGPPGWAVFGAATGALLVWLLRRREEELAAT